MLPGVIGLLQAVETVKILLDLGDLLVGRLVCYDALGGRFRELKVPRDPACSCAGAGSASPGA